MDVNSDEWRSRLNYVRRKWRVQEDVVVSGMSGRFPKSANIQEFAENLFKRIDMTSHAIDRFPAGMHGYPINCGMVPDLQKFDADFFGIPEKDAHLMDPQLRKLLEVSFEALIDAGISVKELNGSNTGFFCGFCFEETDMAFHEDPLNLPSYQQNYTTTISQAFGLKGPIGSFDTACGSSFAALNEAFVALKSGVCDRALVVGYNICLIPLITLKFRDLQMVSSSGKSKSLDESADGYGRSEAVCCVILQLKPEAKRIYSTIVNCRSNSDGYKEQGITFPSVFLQRQLMAETYDEVGIDPTTIEYVEAHTTGTQVGDPVELKAIYDVFCYQRSADDPLKIGSLKSNMGHAEGASGLCALIKANIVFQSGYIPPNINFKKPNPRIEGLMNGKLVPILEKTPFKGDYISLNCFGFGGSNAHIILKAHKVKNKLDNHAIVLDIPRLVPICGRVPESVQRIQKFLKDNQSSLTNEFLDLLNQFSETPSMPHKGYTLINWSQDCLKFEEYVPEFQPSESGNVCLILPSDPIKFALHFMQIPVFMASLNRLAKHVESFGIDLSQLLLNKSSIRSTCERTVGIVASQLIIINLLREIKLSIHSFISNSLGQLAYAFIKDLITEERAMNAAYWLGYLIDHEEIPSKKIDIFSYKSIQEQNYDPSDNWEERESYWNMSESLFEIKRVECATDLGESARSISNIQDLLELVEKNDLKIQKSKNENAPKLSPITYYTLIFQQINKLFPIKVISDLSPMSILINFGPSNCMNLPPKQIQFIDNNHLELERFFKSIGQLYTMHIPIDISCFYPQIDYPVPIDTLSLHSLINFNHSQDWSVFKYPLYYNTLTERSSFLHVVALNKAEDWFFSDHKIDGRILFPATGMLMQVWDVVARFHGIDTRRSKVLFRDVSFTRATVLSDKEIDFRVNYLVHNNSFIITESDSSIAHGKIFVIDNIEEEKENYRIIDRKARSNSLENVECHDLSREDIYKELRNRGYDYGPSFQCLMEADRHGRSGKVEWREVSQLSLKSGSIFEKIYESQLSFLKTWITFSDSVLQLALLTNRFNRSLFVPTRIEAMLVDAEKIMANVNAFNERELLKKSEASENEKQEGKEKQDKFEPKKSGETEKDGKKNSVIFDVLHDPITRTIITDGLWIRGLKASLVPRRSQRAIIETQDFVPFHEPAMLEPKYRERLESYLRACEKYAELITSGKHLDDEPLMRPEALERLSQNFAFKEDSSFGLLDYLICMLNQNGDEVDISKTAQDILVGKDSKYSLLNRFLEPFINIGFNDLAYGGQNNQSINILEHNDGKNYCVQIVRSTVESQSMGTAKASYTFARNELDQEVEEKISESASLITWDAESPLDGEVARANFIIYKNYSGNIFSFRLRVEHLTQAIKPGGFLLVMFREGVSKKIENICSKIPQLNSVVEELKASCMRGEDVITLMEEKDWICVSDRLPDPELLPFRGLLFRKKFDSNHEPKIIHISPLRFQWIEEVKTAIKDENKMTPILLIGDSGYDQGVVGFMNCLGLEFSDDRLICVANRFLHQGIDFTNIKLKDPLIKHILEKRLRFNIYDPDYGWGEYNHFEVEEKHEEDPRCLIESPTNVQLEIIQPGDFSSLKWCKIPVIELSNDYYVKVGYSSLNFRDIMVCSGRLPVVFAPSAKKMKEESMSVKIGFEFSGHDENGNRVMGMTSSEAMATLVPLKPDDFIWPVPENWTLEDAATVPVVYITAIYGLIMRGNLKRGESVLIHAGSGGVGIAAIQLCLGYGCAIFTTVGTQKKRKFLLERFPQLKEANIGNSRDTSFEEMVLRETDGRGVDIVLNSLSDDKLQASLRCLAPGGRFLDIGKYDGFKNSLIELGWLDNGRSFHGVMLDSFFNSDGMVSVAVEKKRAEELLNKMLENGTIKPLPRTVFEMERAEDAFRYMAAGKHIGKVVIKVRDPKNFGKPLSISALNVIKFDSRKVYIIVGGFGGLGLEVALWLAFNGAKNIVMNSRNGPKTSYHQYCLDRLTENGVNSVISTHDLTNEESVRELISSLPLPVGGIFNSALVLSDGLFFDQTEETFMKVCTSKVNITRNLDKISREMCPSLNYFIVFSSIASGRGNPGQSNYGLANSFMESLCERRRRDGLHGLAIQWGFIGDVGFVVEKLGFGVPSIRGTAPQRLHSVLVTLERVLNYPNSTILSMVKSEEMRLESSGDIIKSICHVLGIKDIYALDPQITLGELGMDSLMAIEVQQTMDRHFNVSITPKEVRRMKICELIALSKKFDANETVRSKLSRIDFDLSEDSQFLPEEPTTRLNNCSGELIFALPPLQSHYQAFSGLLERLDQPVAGLNWTCDLLQLATFEDVARVFADRIEILTSSHAIVLIAYSYGGILAREIVRQFEKRESGPKVIKLVLLDSDSNSIKKMIAENFNYNVSSGSEDLQEQEFIKASMKGFQIENSQFEEDIKNATSRIERFNIAKKYMTQNGVEPSRAEKLMKISQLMHHKFRLLLKYEPQQPFSCKVIHLRAGKESEEHVNTRKDDDIGSHYFFDGDHNNFISENLDQITSKVMEFLNE